MKRMKKITQNLALLSFLALGLSSGKLLAQEQVSVTKSNNEVSIGNKFLKRTFSIKDKHLKPKSITNLRAGATLLPDELSEEFAIKTVAKKGQATGLLDRSDWTVTADGFNNDGNTGLIEHSIDGNTDTYWHSHYSSNTNKAMPHHLLFDLKESKAFRSFGYQGRIHANGANTNGQIKGYKIYAGDDANNLTLLKTGELKFIAGEPTWVNLNDLTTARYVKFEATSSHNGQPFANCAEFYLSTEKQKEKIVEEAQIDALDRTGWTVTVDSWCHESDNVGEAENILDGDPMTCWHSWYPGQSQGTLNKKDLPHWFIIDTKKATTFRNFIYTPRFHGDNGRFNDFEFYISDNGTDWELIKEGTIKYEGREPSWVMLDKEYTARYVKLKELNSTNGGPFGTCAEFNLGLMPPPPPKVDEQRILASKLTIKDVIFEPSAEGVKLIFDMEPYTYVNEEDLSTTTWDIDMVVEMKHTDHFMRKYLLIKALDEGAKETAIDYITMEQLNVGKVPQENKWGRPVGSAGVGGMSGYTLGQGQPFYLEGLFFGSEFPQAENEILKGVIAHSNYYTGKSFKVWEAEGRLEDGAFKTWANVIGSARSTTNLDVIRSDFFAYIETIARPSSLRLQYNSWYDWMMRIDEEKINKSFKEMEKGFSQYGIRPMDSYVVDDGWNNYEVSDAQRSGTGTNKTGFWEFNSKFPNGLEGASDIAHKYGSDFGIWLGPRGGYNFNGHWGHFLERHGNGTYNQNSGDAVTGDKVYIQKLEDFFLENQKKYGVNYWKLDGFSTVQPQASTNGRYITGGKNGNYYFTEHWERWYNTLDKLYAEAEGRGSKLWLNLTCYVNPSPWILQFCNSVWIQNSNDKGNLNVGGRTRQMDQFLSYRDDRYYAFINDNQLQFPLANIFNHDPIYGQENGVAANSMTDSEFRAYLYMMSTRGMAFWEMLYSYNFMNEGQKWMINSEAINFAEDNFYILKNAKYFGQSPRKGNIYGYSCWTKKDGKAEGIVSFRNPSNSEKTYTFTLNKEVGVPEGATGLWRSLIMEYSGNQNEGADDVKLADDNNTSFSYDGTINVTLKAGEIRVYRFSSEKDVTPAEIYTVIGQGGKKVQLKFNEPVFAEKEQFSILQGNNEFAQVSEISTAGDYRTITLTLDKELASSTAYNVAVKGLKDWNGNITNIAKSEDFYQTNDDLLLHIRNTSDLAGKADSEDKALHLMLFNSVEMPKSKARISGKGAFSVATLVKTSEGDGNIIKQEGAYSVMLQGGKVAFTVGSVTMLSDKTINDEALHQVVCTRENNGMLKIYIDGKLDKTVYKAEQLNEALTMGEVAIGQKGLELTLANIKVSASALPYDVVATNFTSAEEKPADDKVQTSVKKLDKALSIRVLSDKFIITGFEGIAQARLWDLQGRLLKEQTALEPLSITHSSLPQAIYLLELKTANGQKQTYKLIKE